MNTLNQKINYKKIFLQVTALAGILAAVIFRKNWSSEARTIFINLPGFSFIPKADPENILEWFSLIQDQPFMAFVFLDFFDIINYILVLLLFIGLYLILKEEYPRIMLFALTTGIIGVILCIYANPALQIVNLSKDYFSTAILMEQNEIILQAEAIFSRYSTGPNEFGILVYCSQFCFALAGLIFAITLIKSPIFTKKQRTVGIIAHGLLLLVFPLLLISAAYSYIPIPLASIPLLIWYFSLGKSIWKSTKMQKTDENNALPE